jgi:hypothetical protein
MAKIAIDHESGRVYITQWIPPVIAADGTITTPPRIIAVVNDGDPVTVVTLPADDVQTAKTPTGVGIIAQPDGKACHVYDQGATLTTTRSGDWGATWA